MPLVAKALTTPFPRLRPEARVELGGISHRYVEKADDGLVFRNEVTGRTDTYAPADLLRIYMDGKFVIPPQVLAGLPRGLKERLRFDLRDLCEEDQAQAMHRYLFVSAFERLSRERKPGRRRLKKVERDFDTVARIVSVLHRTARPSACTLRDWYRRWERSGSNPTALVGLDHLKGRKPKVFPPTVVAVVADLARRHHLKPEGISLSALHVVVEGKLRDQGREHGAPLDCPTESQLGRIVADLVTPEEKLRLVATNRKARRVYAAKRRRAGPEGAFDVVEIDHFLLDAVALRERTGVPLETEEDAPALKRGIAGRVWVTVAFCARTRCIAGWSLSLDPPSYVSVMKCLRHMMTVKPDLVVGDLVVPNPVWGKPKVVHVDNGREFHSFATRVAAASLRFEIRHMPKRRPWERGKIERLFRDAQREVANVPGKTFSNAVKRDEYDSEGNARLTMAEIERRFTVFAVGLHRHEENRALFNLTPAEAWEEVVHLGVDYPDSPEAVELLTRKVLPRMKVLRDVGIEHLGLFWHSDAFEELLSRKGVGQKYVASLDPLDLTRMTLIEDTALGPVRHEGIVDRPDLVKGIDLDMWERIWNRSRERTPQGERIRREIVYRCRLELLDEARERDLAGGKLPKPVAKFADAAAREEAEERRRCNATAEAVEVAEDAGPDRGKNAPGDRPPRARPPVTSTRPAPARSSVALRSLDFA